MSTPKILLIRASHTSEDVRNFKREVPADVSVLVPHINNRYDPKNFPIEDYDGYIITGSKSSVLENKDWMDKLSKFVRLIVNKDKPILGVCWGHQFLASTFGGNVEKLKKRELGYRGIQIVYDKSSSYSGVEIDKGDLFMGFPEEFAAFQTHEDYVTKIPDSGEILAENNSGIQSFKYKSAYGVQFHPEFDYETALKIYQKYKDEPTDPEEPQINSELWARSRTSSDLFNNFIHQIVENQ